MTRSMLNSILLSAQCLICNGAICGIGPDSFSKCSSGFVIRVECKMISIQILVKMLDSKYDHQRFFGHVVWTFLLTYRLTPHLVTGEAPSKLMLGKIIRTSLDLV